LSALFHDMYYHNFNWTFHENQWVEMINQRISPWSIYNYMPTFNLQLHAYMSTLWCNYWE
jgi:hypothetical protein